MNLLGVRKADIIDLKRQRAKSIAYHRKLAKQNHWRKACCCPKCSKNNLTWPREYGAYVIYHEPGKKVITGWMAIDCLLNAVAPNDDGKPDPDAIEMLEAERGKVPWQDAHSAGLRFKRPKRDEPVYEYDPGPPARWRPVMRTAEATEQSKESKNDWRSRYATGKHCASAVQAASQS